MRQITFHPYVTSRMYRNLSVNPEGVLHITDDVNLLAKAALRAVVPFPESQPAECVCGCVLSNCCRYYEFRVASRPLRSAASVRP